MNSNNHHYAVDAAKLVEKCRRLIHSILDIMQSKATPTSFQRQSYQLATLSDALKCIDRLIHAHLLYLLDQEIEFLSTINESDVQKKSQLNQFFGEHKEFPTLMDTVETLKLAVTISREYEEQSIMSQKLFSATGEKVVGDNHWRAVSSRSPLLSPPAPPAVSGASPTMISSPRLDVKRSSIPQTMNLAEQRLSPPPTITGIDSVQRCSPPPPPPKDVISYSSPTNSPQQTRHRKTLSKEFIDRSPLIQARRNKSKLNPSKSAKESSLFRLIVTLQLCLVRIEEANSILCDGQACAADRISNTISGRSRSESFQRRSSSSDLGTCNSSSSEISSVSSLRSNQTNNSSLTLRTRPLLALTLGMGGVAILAQRSDNREGQLQVLKTTGKVAATITVASYIRKRWQIICMKERIANSADALEDWIFKWICLVNDKRGPADGAGTKLLTHRKMNSFWYSNGSLRIQLIKRGMDLLYASIGKAIEITREKQSDQTGEIEKSSGLWTYVVASVAASYYNVIGPAAKSAQVTSSPSNSLIQGTWGMVSLRAVKMVSLEATRILKGAAIAGRIEICGVSCFVLSRSEFPVLASALRRFHRQQEREDVRLGTIHEKLSSNPSSANVSGFQSKNVILHLTGGGFFAHTIAGDLPYLLDWSAATDSVVIIPEYALLPRHKFPVAMQEVKRIYSSLRFGHALSLLGFRPDKIILTGESVGGNLASALCVSLILDHDNGQYSERSQLTSMELASDRDEETDDDWELAGNETQEGNGGLGLPDALMLCCPALNFSSDDSSHSRINGAHDPVLPSGLLAVISSSYVQNESERNNPLVSPFFATDATLKQFPSTMIFTGSEDPLLDDSVTFNARLRSLGVKSYLRAVNDMPHAFWALSTAGIGLDVQQECREWLRKSFAIEI